MPTNFRIVKSRKWVVVWCIVLFGLLAPASAQSQVDAILEKMTLEQKIGQMFMVSFFGPQINAPFRDLLETWQPGAVVLLPSNIEEPQAVTRLTNNLQQTLISAGSLPMWIAVDQEGGVIAHLYEGFTTWPVSMLLTAAGDKDLAARVGEAMATEMLAVGINMNLAPVADLHTNPANPIIGRRSFGTDPSMVSPIVSAVVRGMQDQGVLATVKHFPGHGDTAVDSHHELPQIDYPRSRLDSVELAPFRSAFDAGVGAAMVAHIWYPALDENAGPASLSESVVTGLLRNELGYEGLILTDALDMDSIDTVYRPEEAVLMAVKAGHDIILTGAHVSPETHGRTMQAVLDAVLRGEIDEVRIDASVRRILETKLAYGLLDWQPLVIEQVEERLNLAAHALLVDELFRAGITLVYDSNGYLPLTSDQSVTVIYPATRPSIWTACSVVGTGLQPIGVSANPTETEITWAAASAQQSDVVVVFTMNADESPSQQTLVNSLPVDKTLVVALWSPYDVLAFPGVSTYMVTYSPLPAAYPAVCDALFGNLVPQGVLPVPLGDLFSAGTGMR